MLKNILGLIICGFLFLTSGVILSRAENSAQCGTSPVTFAQNVGNKVCPVTGDKISADTNVTYEYQGKIYNFCCAGCIEEFKKDPLKYIKKVEKEKNSSLSVVNK